MVLIENINPLPDSSQNIDYLCKSCTIFKVALLKILIKRIADQQRVKSDTAYVYDLHKVHCHDVADCKKFHPVIKDGMLCAKITVIKRDVSRTDSSKMSSKDSKNSICQMNWHFCEEPEIMQKFGCKFSEKMAFFSETDLYCSGIEGFSSVVIQANGSRAVFTAVPCPTVQIGTLRLYEEGIMNHLNMAKDTTLVTVEKIDNFKIGKSIKLTTNEKVEIANTMIPKTFKRKFHYAYDYGIPFLLEKDDTLSVQLPGSRVIQVKTSVQDVEPSKDFLHIQSAEGVDVSQSSITRSLGLLSLEDSALETSPSLGLNEKVDFLSKKDLSLIERIDPKELRGMDEVETRNGNHSFKTSTPMKNGSENSVAKGTRVKKKRKRKNEDATSSLSRKAEQPSTFYRLQNNFTSELVYDNTKEQTLSERKYLSFIKDESFYLLKDVIKKKMLYSPQEMKLRCPWTGILLSGLPGMGKSFLVKEVAAELGLPLITVSLLGWSASSSSNYVQECYNEASRRAPSILVFEDLDSLCHSVREQNRENFTSKIIKIIAKLKTLTKPVLVIGTSNRSEAIPDSLRRVGRFDREIILALPNSVTRGKILWQLLITMKHNLTQEDVNHLGDRAFGLSKADLDSVVRVAWQKAVSRWKDEAMKGGSEGLRLNVSDLEEGISSVSPSFLRQNYSAISAVRWSDIFGYDHIKTKLKKMVACSSSESHFSKGVLLYGPPGCSKTMLVRALATETKFTFFPVKCSDLLSKFVGETEKHLCSVFKRAMLGAPSVIFMDEIDSLCGRRAGSGSGSSVVTELLSLLHNSRKEANIFVVGATNRPQAVDEALFSPGGLEQLIHVDLPDFESRCSIWEGLLKASPTSSHINLELLSRRSEGLSCAEICIAYQNAANSLLNSLHSGEITWEESKLSEQLLLKTIESVVPRTPSSLLTAINSFKSTKYAVHE